MKLKIFTLIILSAIVTLSFAFAVKVDHKTLKPSVSSESSQTTEPIGGFAFDEK